MEEIYLLKKLECGSSAGRSVSRRIASRGSGVRLPVAPQDGRNLFIEKVGAQLSGPSADGLQAVLRGPDCPQLHGKGGKILL